MAPVEDFAKHLKQLAVTVATPKPQTATAPPAWPPAGVQALDDDLPEPMTFGVEAGDVSDGTQGRATDATAASPNAPRPDGPDGGRWLWWQNRRHNVPKGTVYRLLARMWGRESASYGELEDAQVFDSSVAPQTVRSYANKANTALPGGFPWQLSTDSANRQLTKVAAAKGHPRGGAS